MAMEMISAPTKVIVAFDSASRLQEGSHREAFLSAFENTLRMLDSFLNLEGKVSLQTRRPVRSTVFTGAAGSSTQTTNHDRFFSSLRTIAGELYDCELTEISILFAGQRSWRLVIASDPIYFAVEPEHSPRSNPDHKN